jgi:uncharacterized RDD family membrane protein YckC
VKGEIRNQRSRAVQGQRAGVVSQVAAGILDAVTIMLLYIGVLALWGVNVLFFTGNPFRLPQPDPWVNALLYFVIGVAVLSSAWSGSGRAPGMAVVGLRVLDASGETLSPRRAFWRAALVVATLGVGLVTVLFSRRNESLYDSIVGSAVVYDWRPGLVKSRQN